MDNCKEYVIRYTTMYVEIKRSHFVLTVQSDFFVTHVKIIVHTLPVECLREQVVDNSDKSMLICS